MLKRENKIDMESKRERGFFIIIIYVKTKACIYFDLIQKGNTREA